MRIEPPVAFSSLCTVTEDVTIGKYTVKKNYPFSIDIISLHHNKQEWIEPERFIPDRFNPASPYFLAPSGKKRHPMSYGPFLGGKRICLGKTFAEVVGKITGSSFLNFYNFDFVEKNMYLNKPPYDLQQLRPPQFYAKVTPNYIE